MTTTVPAEGAKSPVLIDRHRQAGAEFEDWYGWQMPSRYQPEEAEQDAVRKTVGLIDLSYHGVIRIGGSEGTKFLMGLVTSDVNGLTQGKGGPSAFLTGHGKVRGLCRILSLGSEYLVVNDPQTHDKIFKYVFPFSYAGDFHVADVSAEHRILSVQGPRALLVMKEVCFEPIPDLVEGDWFRTRIAGHQVLVASVSRTGEDGFDIFAPEDALTDIWDFLLLKGDFHQIKAVGQQALEALRIEAGKLVYGKDVDETNMMLETGLTEAVSFTKGCYTGQEAVAMAHYRGHPSKRLMGLLLDGATVPEPGARVLSGEKELGQVTSALNSRSVGQVIALAYLKWGTAPSGSHVEVDTVGGKSIATVRDLPLYRPLDTAR
jgi:folate-binding protein YgfZ